MSDVYKLCRFWSYHRKCFLTYEEWIKESWSDGMTSTLDRLSKLLETPIEFDEFVLSLQTEEWREGFMTGVSSYKRAIEYFLENEYD